MVVSMAILFCRCTDNYERSGREKAPLVYPVGIGEDVHLTYTEARTELTSEDSATTKVVAVLKSPVWDDYTNLKFPYQTFPNGLTVDFFDDEGQKSIIKADYGILYSLTDIIDLQGNVIIESHDGKILEAPQLFWDQNNNWIFTQNKFRFTNPEDGTVMDGEGMDFNRNLSNLYAHKTYGLMTIKEESE